jgi:hypothetical protein
LACGRNALRSGLHVPKKPKRSHELEQPDAELRAPREITSEGEVVAAAAGAAVPDGALPGTAASAGIVKEELFHGADILTIHLVLSQRTKGLVGAEELQAMKTPAARIRP